MQTDVSARYQARFKSDQVLVILVNISDRNISDILHANGSKLLIAVELRISDCVLKFADTE